MKTEVLHSTDFIASRYNLSRGEILKRTIFLKIKPQKFERTRNGERWLINMYTLKDIERITAYPYSPEE